MRQSHYTIGFLIGVVGYILVSRTFGDTLGEAFVCGMVAIVGGAPLLLAWRASGAVLVPLGRSIRPSQAAGALALLAVVAWTGYDALAATHDLRPQWFRVAAALLISILVLVQLGRGLSLREHGVLALEGYVPWEHLDWWMCDEADSTLTIRVRGTGYFQALRVALPASYKSITWTLDTERLAAARRVLRDKVPNREAAP